MRFFSTKRKKNNSKGTTLIEMVVSFALLGIFVSLSTVIIANVTTLYYRVRGESYARQVGDIVVNKIAAELSGAMYSNIGDSFNVKISDDFDGNPSVTVNPTEHKDISGNVACLYDRNETGMSMFASDGILYIYYREIDDETEPEKSRQPVYWTFDKNIYNGYEIKNLEFVEFAPGNNAVNQSLAQNYGITDVGDISDYPSNIVAVYMKLKSDRYGEFNICRYIKLYNYPEDYDWNP